MSNKYTQDMTGTGDHVELPEEPKKIYESPDGGKTVYERNFGETERRLVDDDDDPEPERYYDWMLWSLRQKRKKDEKKFN